MSSVRIKLKLNVDLDIQAEREDVPQLTESVKQQLAGAFSPAALVAQCKPAPKQVDLVNMADSPAAEPRASHSLPPVLAKPRRTRKAAPRSKENGAAAENAVDWSHDPAKWGTPAQSWNTVDRCLWLLYVLKQEKGVNELSAAAIAATLCKHFKQAGLVYQQIVSRELGRVKTSAPALVGEDSRQNPSLWFLTEEGQKRAENLVTQVRAQTAIATAP
jgi:hypothetical protein